MLRIDFRQEDVDKLHHEKISSSSSLSAKKNGKLLSKPRE
jgi:hypothetical protein